MNKIKAKYKQVQTEGYTHNPIMGLSDNIGTDGRMCNCCKTRTSNRQDLTLGCDNYSVSVCLCEQCLVILHDMLGEYLENIGGVKHDNTG